MIINWEDYFEHIVIISAAKYKDRRNILNQEFTRIGLSNYEYFINIYDNLLSDKIYDNNINRKCCLHAHYFVIKRAYELNWDSVLIFEDDIRFLKDESKIIDCLEEFKKVKNKSNIYMFDWILFNYYDEEDQDFFGAAGYWLDRKGMEYFIYMIEHYPLINDSFFMKICGYYDTLSYGYRYYDIDDKEFSNPIDIDIYIPPNTVLPCTLNISSLRLCVQVDNGEVISKYYTPPRPENAIDENLYQLYK